MKIALIDPSLFTWPYDNALAEGLKERGHEVLIYSKYLMDHEPGKHAPGLCELFYPGFEHKILQSLPKKLFMILKGAVHPFCMMKLYWELRRFKPYIIHFQWTPLPALDRFFIGALRRIAPVILTVHDSMPFNNNPGSKLQRVGAIDIMYHFDRLIVHTLQAEKRLVNYGVAASRIARIPHGVLGTEVTSLTPPPPAVMSDGVTLLLFGKLKPYKGADVLIRAVAAVAPAMRSHIRLRIVGKAYMEVEPLQALAKELDVENNIIWDLRFVEESEIPAILAQADIMVMPYREIDASGVLMIALAAARPIIASRIGLFAEMLEDEKHGYLVTPEDAQGLAGAITKLASDKEIRLRMGNDVRAIIDSIPSWNAIAGMTEALYQEAMSTT